MTGNVCPDCSAPIQAGARFCHACGHDVSGQQGQIATKQVAVSNTQQFKQALLASLRDATLGEYEVLAELGSGGMATVFLAHDIHLDRKVAIKVMSPHLLAGEGMVERFKLEAKTAAGLSHPNIIPIFAVRQHENLLYFVMKFVEGTPLDGVIAKEAPLPVPMVRQIVSRVADALGYAHRRGVIHRDIKPANIMIDTEGMPVVTDFGIAKVSDAQGLTMTGATIGTPTYMSPEQCNALAITGASDQYSLGVMAYEMLAGQPMFRGESVMTLMYKHVHEAPPQVAATATDCPPDLADAVMRMVAKRPEERFPSMDDVVKAFAAPALAYDDPVRTKLIEFAMAGENRTILQRVSTPRSPIPVGTRAGRKSTTPATRVREAPQDTTGRRRLALGAGVLVLALAGVIFVLQPWSRPESSVQENAVPEASIAPPVGEAPPEQGGGGEPEPSVTPEMEAPPPAEPRPQGSSQTVASVRLVGAPSALEVDQSAQVTAQVADTEGRSLPLAVTWRSSDESVARVSPSGEVTALRPGTATITASAGGVSSRASVSVVVPTVRQVEITPATLRLERGGASRLAAQVRSSRGDVLDRAVVWSSSDPSVATVTADGEVRATSAGTVAITATADSVRGVVQVTVIRSEPTESELRQSVVDVIQGYAAALEARDVGLVRNLYPTMTAEREQQLRQALPAMQNLDVQLQVGEVRLAGDRATASVTGRWVFNADGRRSELPATNTYQLERRGAGWVITAISQ